MSNLITVKMQETGGNTVYVPILSSELRFSCALSRTWPRHQRGWSAFQKTQSLASPLLASPCFPALCAHPSCDLSPGLRLLEPSPATLTHFQASGSLASPLHGPSGISLGGPPHPRPFSVSSGVPCKWNPGPAALLLPVSWAEGPGSMRGLQAAPLTPLPPSVPALFPGRPGVWASALAPPPHSPRPVVAAPWRGPSGHPLGLPQPYLALWAHHYLDLYSAHTASTSAPKFICWGLIPTVMAFEAGPL